MAFQQSTNWRGGVFAQAYWRFVALHFNHPAQSIEVVIACYANQTEATAGRDWLQPFSLIATYADLATFGRPIDQGNPYAGIYRWLKQRVPGDGEPDFRNATDV